MPERSFAKQAAMQLVAGGSAGCVEVSIMHPLDLVKTRLQIQSAAKGASASASAEHYAGVADCFKKMYRAEGVLSFWKGVIPPLMAETPKRAWKFFTFEQFKVLFKVTPDQPQALTYSLAGLGAGVTEAILVNPFEVVKVRMQSNRSSRAAAPSTFSVAKDIVRESGVFGRNGLLGKGVTATMSRNGYFNMVYFGFYFSVKDYLPQVEDHKLELLMKFATGLTAGTLASCFNIPFDVAKSRIQGPQPVPGQVFYSGTLRTIGVVYRNEGLGALYKGLLPKVMRLGPGGAIMLLVYEYTMKFLQKRFPD